MDNRKKSKFAQKEITNYLQEKFANTLEPKLLKLGFIPPLVEKGYPGHKIWKRLKFDICSKEQRRRGKFVVWEIEILRQWASDNVFKLDEILSWSWKPKIIMFHIFSPNCINQKKCCSDKAKELKKKHSGQLIYIQFDIDIPYIKFNKMLNAFESNKYQARQYYSKDLGKEIKKIVKRSLSKM